MQAFIDIRFAGTARMEDIWKARKGAVHLQELRALAARQAGGDRHTHPDHPRGAQHPEN